jgi:hypothetical protein
MSEFDYVYNFYRPDLSPKGQTPVEALFIAATRNTESFQDVSLQIHLTIRTEARVLAYYYHRRRNSTSLNIRLDK